MDGFDIYSSATTKAWLGSSYSMATDTRFGSGQCMKINSGASMQRLLAASEEHATIILGCAFRRETTANPTAHYDFIFRSDSNSRSHVTVSIQPDGSIAAWRGDYNSVSPLGQSAAANLVPPGVWHYIEIKVTVHDTTGAIEVRIDGSATPVINLSNVDTKNGGTKTTIDSFSFYTSNGNGMSLDDMYILNPNGSANTAFLGDVRVETIVPTGPGANTGLTPSTGANWAAVDELPANTSDTVASDVAGTKDTYTMGDLSAGAGTVYAVQVGAYAQKTDSGARQIKPVVRHSGADYSGTALPVGTSYGYVFAIYETNPGTSATWTVAHVNAAEIGAEVV